MGYKLTQTLTAKGYKTHKAKQNKHQQLYYNINRTQVYKQLKKLINELKSKNLGRNFRQEIMNLFRCDEYQHINLNRSYTNRQMHILEIDKMISFNLGTKKDLMLRKYAMQHIRQQYEFQSMINIHSQTDQQIHFGNRGNRGHRQMQFQQQRYTPIDRHTFGNWDFNRPRQMNLTTNNLMRRVVEENQSIRRERLSPPQLRQPRLLQQRQLTQGAIDSLMMIDSQEQEQQEDLLTIQIPQLVVDTVLIRSLIRQRYPSPYQQSDHLQYNPIDFDA